MKVDINELRKVRGIGDKTLKRIKENFREDDYLCEYDPSLHLDRNSINLGDCLELMNGIEDKSVDMILADLPYGTTACSWDSIIDLDKLWQQYERVIKDNRAIVLTASQPFTNTLISSNKRLYRYNWVWEKEQGVNFLLAKKQPLKIHEDVVVFYKEQPTYNPQMTEGKPYISGKGSSGEVTGNVVKMQTVNEGTRYPTTRLKFNRETGLHPTQKPVKLFKYLIKTYTNEGDLVLDNTAGVATTAIASITTNRDYICIEKEEEYYKKGKRWTSLVKSGMDYKEALKKVKKEFGK